MTGVDYEAAMAVLRRGPVLAACRDEPRSRREIADIADLSRTTAYRATTELVEDGLLAARNGGYETTTRGEAMQDAVDRFREGVATVDRLDPLLSIVDHPDLIEHAHLLGDVEVVVADADDPYRVADRAVERLAETDVSQGTLANVTAVEAMRNAESRLPELDRFERILTDRSLTAHEAVTDDLFDTILAEAGVDLLVAPEAAVPFSFAIDDVDVSITGHDPQTGIPTVHVETAEPAAREWLEGVYERCRTAAEPV